MISNSLPRPPRNLPGRVEPGSTIVHDGAKCHSQAIAELGLKDETAVFDPGGEAYEKKMALLSNPCSYIRHSFEAHRGVKKSKIEAYANFFLYRWSHIRKAGLKDSIEYLFNRLSRTNKSKAYRESFKRDWTWRGFLTLICTNIQKTFVDYRDFSAASDFCFLISTE